MASDWLISADLLVAILEIYQCICIQYSDIESVEIMRYQCLQCDYVKLDLDTVLFVMTLLGMK